MTIIYLACSRLSKCVFVCHSVLATRHLKSSKDTHSKSHSIDCEDRHQFRPRHCKPRPVCLCLCSMLRRRGAATTWNFPPFYTLLPRLWKLASRKHTKCGRTTTPQTNPYLTEKLQALERQCHRAHQRSLRV